MLQCLLNVAETGEHVSDFKELNEDMTNRRSMGKVNVSREL